MIRMSMRVDTSVLDRGMKMIKPSMKQQIEGLTNDVVAFLHQNWSGSSPSEPGSPPAVVTGALDASIRKDATGRDASGRFASGDDVISWFIRVGDSKAWYAADLEEGRASTNLAPRPYIDPAFKSIEDKLPEGVKVSFKRSFI